jgi:hypothetical protein
MKILDNDIKLYKSILNNHIDNIDDFMRSTKEYEVKQLEKQFEKGNKKVLEMKKIIYKVRITNKENQNNHRNNQFNKTNNNNNKFNSNTNKTGLPNDHIFFSYYHI